MLQSLASDSLCKKGQIEKSEPKATVSSVDKLERKRIIDVQLYWNAAGSAKLKDLIHFGSEGMYVVAADYDSCVWQMHYAGWISKQNMIPLAHLLPLPWR